MPEMRVRCWDKLSKVRRKDDHAGRRRRVSEGKDINVPSNDLISRQARNADFIERQMAIDALGEEPEVWSGKDEYEQGLNNQWHHDVNALKALPSAQAEPTFKQIKEYCERRGLTVITNDLYHGLITEYSAPPERKKGRWINAKCKDGTTAHKCSECRKLVGYSVSSLTWFDFCPWCGADMRGG